MIVYWKHRDVTRLIAVVTVNLERGLDLATVQWHCGAEVVDESVTLV